MTIKQLIKLEDKAREVWVISPGLHWDTENKEFSELVSVNLGEKTKYRYIVPATRQIERNLKVYKKLYDATDTDIATNFLFLPESEFNPFITESAIYDASGSCIACAAPGMVDGKDVIRFDEQTSKSMAAAFRKIWRKYKRSNP